MKYQYNGKWFCKKKKLISNDTKNIYTINTLKLN